jgi:hypothetical protein
MKLDPGQTYDASGDDHEEVVGALHFFAQEESSNGPWDITLVVNGEEISGVLGAVHDGVVAVGVDGARNEIRYGDIESVRVAARD